MAAMSWETDARCRVYDPEIFFDTRARSERKAKSICSKCEVRTECLAFAIQSRSEFGIWGGLNVRERVALARRSGRLPNDLVLAPGGVG
jgi:WhiB family transcriptional regulator, redox-sensing transcriptional regulator